MKTFIDEFLPCGVWVPNRRSMSKLLGWQREQSQSLIEIVRRDVPTPRARPGRPRKTTEREDRYLLRLCRNDRIKSAKTLGSRFTNTPVSGMLMNLRLICADYFARRPLKKLLFLQRHQQAGMDWARNDLCWRPGHWQHVIFSDEFRFLFYG